MFIKIDSESIECTNNMCWLTWSVYKELFGDKLNIDIELDINKNPEYYQYFIDKYEKRNTFKLTINKFIANDCIIKKIDVIFESKLNLSILCSKINDLSDNRDEIISEILKK